MADAVVQFPKQKRRQPYSGRPKTDDELVEAVRSAFRKLCRTVDAARSAKITVEIELKPPTFSKKL